MKLTPPPILAPASCIAAPLDHALYELLGTVFAGKTSRRARLGELLVANGLILPIQNAVYLAALSVLNGARTIRQVATEVRAQLLEIMQLTAVVQTVALLVAQRFLPPAVWTPFFASVAAVVDTVINVQAKSRAISEEGKDGDKKEL
ncbi:hypothetical protein JCM10908_005929 [Rhodotorula pacifica]|uniref:uncharacterized protein n=1 Tax=Rhodotorula pacifica TaxID=1495444 RepID=UPI00317CA945